MMSERDLERGPQGDHGQHGDTGPTGPVGPQGEPGKDAKRYSLWPTLRFAAFVLVAAASIFAAARTYDIADDVRKTVEASEESRAEARHQICLGDEREHLEAVNNLKQLYAYVATLRDDEIGSTFNRFIIAGVPENEREARTDVAPAFCDITLPGNKPVGLPEPDPVVPKRPAKVDERLEELANFGPVIQDLRNPDRKK